jgi:hypothetical protein
MMENVTMVRIPISRCWRFAARMERHIATLHSQVKTITGCCTLPQMTINGDAVLGKVALVMLSRQGNRRTVSRAGLKPYTLDLLVHQHSSDLLTY